MMPQLLNVTNKFEFRVNDFRIRFFLFIEIEKIIAMKIIYEIRHF